MKLLVILITLGCVGLVCVSKATCEDEPTDMPPYFVAPIKTELQRREISATAKAYAVVNCNAFLVDSRFAPDAVDTTALVSELQKLAGADPGPLKLVMRFQLGGEIERSTRTTIKNHVKQICQSAGFDSVSTSEINTSASWENHYKPLKDFVGGESAIETVKTDRLINAYPLRTKLSRIVIGDADCVIEIKQPIDGRQQELSPELQSAIRSAIESFGPELTKRKLLFRVRSTDAGRELVEQIFDARRPPEIPENVKDGPLFDFLQSQQKQYRPSPAMKLARALGFDAISYTHSPGGGAPEKRIGHPAPDFALDRVGGDRLELSRFLNGRPGLVTFWGVACGPCRLEAPHLTRLHQKYQDRFAIVAVNGYNETPEVVAKFAAQNQLDHPIVVGGGKVASKAYFVGAYPTTFFVDRNGTVVDYKVGFDSGEELEERVREMVGDGEID
ncbi:Thiol-disulfide oxidoreductase ResA [Stieleria neptunia]|uniref:Thiol-disulfide oxidoreductase ResA n=1 Tax=Stieleria neptunia TaxID=2527979 RepID=A0A518HPL4_9BACT|nr:TlpA disulfide reductase family protein [Stieleria neptunia]QDV42774.1 Thiol-disulfide oxidoreductase ResA [Stieleria neptunia]